MTTPPHPAKRRRSSVVSRWSVALLALAIGLGLAELTLRALGLPRLDATFQFVRPDGELSDVFGQPYTLVADAELFWKQAPGPHPPASLVNRLGLRGPLPQRAKGPRDLRIACVGDSCTYGMGVRYDDVYGAQLERLVQAARSDLSVEAMLIGLPGYSTYQSRVLFERHAAELAPDVTILYCGAWNDYLPAVGRSDTARARVQARSSRLLAMLDRATEPSPAQLAAHRDEFRAGRAPYGRRVSVDEFRANVRALLAQARAVGSRVIVLVPPMPATTVAVHTAGAEYRACLRELAASEQLPTVDGEALFAARADQPKPVGPLFLDWVHPTAAGHALLAQALAPLVLAAAPAASPEAPSPAVALERVEPATVSAFATQPVILSGPGLGARGLDRVMVGERWLPDVRVLDADRVQVALTRLVAPGRHAVTLRTATGLVGGGALEVLPPVAPELKVVAKSSAGGPVLEVSGAAPAETIATVLLAARRSATPWRTAFGDLYLAPDDPARAWPEPVTLDVLTLTRCTTLSDGGGGFSVQCQVPPQLAAAGTVFVQAALLDPYDRASGVLSEVVAVPLAK